MPKKPDFAGWVTKKDILCTDGVVIKQDAFIGNSGTRVPLVWQHNYDKPGNVLGHMDLENRPEGVYGYGYFNETATADGAKELIRHGDIRAMSIGANKIRKQGRNVVHGSIYEVSLVMVGANSGATIDYTNLAHSSEEDFDNGEGIFYNGMLVHSGEDEPELEEETAEKVSEESEELTHADGGADVADKNDERTVGDVLDTLTEEQKIA
ncbi:HK97 family phage prohead protease, partial [Herbiconiux daphne]